MTHTENKLEEIEARVDDAFRFFGKNQKKLKLAIHAVIADEKRPLIAEIRELREGWARLHSELKVAADVIEDKVEKIRVLNLQAEDAFLAKMEARGRANKVEIENVALHSRLEVAEQASREYIMMTDALVLCSEELTCGSCRGCLMRKLEVAEKLAEALRTNKGRHATACYKRPTQTENYFHFSAEIGTCVCPIADILAAWKDATESSRRATESKPGEPERNFPEPPYLPVPTNSPERDAKPTEPAVQEGTYSLKDWPGTKERMVEEIRKSEKISGADLATRIGGAPPPAASPLITDHAFQARYENVDKCYKAIRAGKRDGCTVWEYCGHLAAAHAPEGPAR